MDNVEIPPSEDHYFIRQQLLRETRDDIEQRCLRRVPLTRSAVKTVSDLEPWSKTLSKLEKRGFDDSATVPVNDKLRRFSFSAQLNGKIYLHQGGITELEVDGIVNAANNTLLGGGGVDGAIHRAAGPLLLEECRSLNGCETGQTKVTKGYDLPAKYVLHTVGPFGKGDSKLQSCYKTSLDQARDRGMRSIALCCIGTGIYSFPLVRAAHIALRCVREWLEMNPNTLDAVVFCTFRSIEYDVYESLMPSYFPSSTFPAEEAADADKVPFPITAETIAAENEAERRHAERYRNYDRPWMHSAATAAVAVTNDVEDERGGKSLSFLDSFCCRR